MAIQFVLNEKCRVLYATPQPHHFFGYFTYSPFDANDVRVLVHRTHCDQPLLDYSAEVEVGYVAIGENLFESLGTTHAVNWQQGAMLQWIPPVRDHVIWNSFINNHLGSVICDLQSRKKEVLPHPIYTVDHTGNFALSVDFRRVSHVRSSYGYPFPHSTAFARPEQDGLFEVDLHSGRSELRISFDRVLAVEHRPSMDGAFHWIDHPSYSPCGEYIAFFHRWQDTRSFFFTRLYCYHTGTDKLYLYPDTGMYSHMCWLPNGSFLVFCRANADPRMGNSLISKRIFGVIQPLYRKYQNVALVKRFRNAVLSDCYLSFCVGDKQSRQLGENLIRRDGHPSANPTKPNLLLTDTYPDSEGYRHVCIYNMESDVLVNVGKFYAGGETSSGPNRCDLHPRWSNDGCKISIDTQCRGYRQMLIIDVSGVL